MVTATLQVCPEPGRRPTRTLPYWATAPLLGCFTACLTESFLAVIQAHRPQVWWVGMVARACPYEQEAVLPDGQPHGSGIRHSFKPQVHAPHVAVGRSPHHWASLLGA